MKIKQILLISIVLCSLGCFKQIDKPTLKKMLQSEDKLQIIEATDYIKRTRDTSMVNDMLKQSFDPRVTHLLKYKGMSIYQIKMGAMKELTGITPPNTITYRPDSVNIEFYLRIARNRNWIK